MPLKATRSVAGQCEERGRHARGQIGKDTEDRTMIPIDAGETLNQLQPTRVLLSPASAPYSSCRQLSSALNTVPGTLTRSSQ